MSNICRNLQVVGFSEEKKQKSPFVNSKDMMKNILHVHKVFRKKEFFELINLFSQHAKFCVDNSKKDLPKLRVSKNSRICGREQPRIQSSGITYRIEMSSRMRIGVNVPQYITCYINRRERVCSFAWYANKKAVGDIAPVI